MSTRVSRLLENAHASEQGREVSERVRLALRLGQMAYDMRTHAEHSQEKLAPLVATTQSALSRLEGGNNGHVPGYEILERIAEECGYRLSMFAEAIEHPPGRDEAQASLTVSLGDH